jgi:hypothetical protein
MKFVQKTLAFNVDEIDGSTPGRLEQGEHLYTTGMYKMQNIDLSFYEISWPKILP